MFDEKNFEALAEKINSVLDQYDKGSDAGRGASGPGETNGGRARLAW
jgi:hypothetical protein